MITKPIENNLEEKTPTRPLSVEDVGLLFKLALDKSNPKLQGPAVKLLSIIPRKGGDERQNPPDTSMSILKSLFGKSLHIIIAITCLVVILYFGIRIFNEVRPRTLEEQKMECLKLGSDYRYRQCLNLIKK